MIERTVRYGLAMLAACVVAGCSGGVQSPARGTELVNAVGSVFQARRQQQDRPVLTRAVLDGLDGAFLEATVEDTGNLAYMFVNADRQDSYPGRVRVWRTEDNVTLTTRQGVLIQTRGLGGDVLATDVDVRAGVLGPASGGERRMQIRALDNRSVSLVGACSLTDLGPSQITIVERVHPTRHIRETCEFPNGAIQNDFWTDSSADVIWQSRQWAGPSIGYITLRQLTR